MFGDGKSLETQAMGRATTGGGKAGCRPEARSAVRGGPRPRAESGGQRPQSGGLRPDLGLHVGDMHLAPCEPMQGGDVLSE